MAGKAIRPSVSEQVTGADGLAPRLTVYTTRIQRDVLQGAQTVAVLCLDRVTHPAE